jgi:hypothetical protein
MNQNPTLPPWIQPSEHYTRTITGRTFSPSASVAGHVRNRLAPLAPADRETVSDNTPSYDRRTAFLGDVLRAAAGTVAAWTGERVEAATGRECSRQTALTTSAGEILRRAGNPLDAVDHATGALLTTAAQRRFLTATERERMRSVAHFAAMRRDAGETASQDIQDQYAAGILAGAVAATRGRELVLQEWPGWAGYFKASESPTLADDVTAYVAAPNNPKILRAMAALAHEIRTGTPVAVPDELRPAVDAGRSHLAKRWAKGKHLERAHNAVAEMRCHLVEDPADPPPPSDGDGNEGNPDAESGPVPGSEPDRWNNRDDSTDVRAKVSADPGEPTEAPIPEDGHDRYPVQERRRDAWPTGIAAMRRDAEPLIQALRRIAWDSMVSVDRERGQRRGDVDDGALYRLACENDERVFELPPDVGSSSVALTLLVDCSGSMRHGRISDAKAVAYALHTVFGSRPGFTVAVAGHDVGYYPPHGGKCHYWLTDGGDHIASLDARGDNADGYAIQHAIRRTLAMPGDRRAVVLLTDGYPNAKQYGTEAASSHVRAVVERGEAAGVQFRAIGVDGCLEPGPARAMFGPGRFASIGPVRGAGPFLGRFIANLARGAK